jgi:Cu2+-exporting ATPase
LHLGSERFLHENDISLTGASANFRQVSRNGWSSLLLAVDGELVGQLVYRDELRAESTGVIRALRERNVSHVAMLTGDNYAAARAVAHELGLDQFHAEILPPEKAGVVRELQRQGRVVAMVGDGINDAPALSYADVGIAMRNGVDIDQQTADVVLIQDDLSKVVTAIDVSREAVGLVHQNYTIVAGLNAFAIAATVAGGLMAPELTALISNGSAVLASVNGLRPLLPSEHQDRARTER